MDVASTSSLLRGRSFRPLLLGVFSFLLLLIAGLGGSSAVGAPNATTIVVRDDANARVPGAQVFRNCVFQGITDSSGVFTLATANAGDHVFVRKLVHTEPTAKGRHDGWAFHVWLTNLAQNDDGTQTDWAITSPTVVQTIRISRNNSQIGFNIVSSIEYNATAANIADIAGGLQSASRYLWDVSDGQMFFERIEVNENRVGWNDADIQFLPSVWPSSSVDGRTGLTGACCHFVMPGPGFDGNSYTGSYLNPDGFRTIVHEFGHYAIGAYDEYIRWDGTAGRWVPSSCTLDRDTIPEASRSSIMGYQYNATELCFDDNHNDDTAHGQLRHDSVWGWLVTQYGGSGWTLRTPQTRGVVNPGPTTLPCYLQAAPVVNDSGLPVCATAPRIHATYLGAPFVGGPVTLEHGGDTIAQGVTDDNGFATIYGANTGDMVGVVKGYSGGGGFGVYAGNATIAACAATIEIELTNYFMPIYYEILEWYPRRPDPELVFRIPIGLGDPQPFELFVDQDGLFEQELALTFDQQTRTYVGSYLADPGLALNFNVGLQAFEAQGRSFRRDLKASVATFDVSGPPGAAADSAITGGAVPVGWGLFPADAGFNVSVAGNSLPDGAGVAVIDSENPAPLPADLELVGGPYSVFSSDVISGPMGISLRYQTDLFGGLVPGTISIYRYDSAGSAWVELPTEIDADQHMAFAALDEWGLYAVFARLNKVANTPVPTPTFLPTATTTPTPTPCAASFSDVNAGDFFYEPVLYLACRGVISGYADGSFAPYNNATRGQMTKIVVLAEGFDLINPAVPTFSDVALDNPFYTYIETSVARGIVSGYNLSIQCGADPTPCFKPFNNVTRGQISKIVVIAHGWKLVNPTTPTFRDVPTTNPFYREIETAVEHGIISGYDLPGGLREFRWFNNATRGQIAKIVFEAVTEEP